MVIGNSAPAWREGTVDGGPVTGYMRAAVVYRKEQKVCKRQPLSRHRPASRPGITFSCCLPLLIIAVCRLACDLLWFRFGLSPFLQRLLREGVEALLTTLRTYDSLDLSVEAVAQAKEDEEASGYSEASSASG